MSYNQTIPVSTDYMVISRPQIKANFQAINQVFAQNHVPLNADTPGYSQGMHPVITFRGSSNLALDPATSVDQVALYTKIISSVPNLFYRPSNNQTAIQLTYPSLSTGLQSSNPDVYLPQQYSFMAGPFVFYFGGVASVDGTIVTLLPATTLLYVGLINSVVFPTSSDDGAAATLIAGNQFTIRTAGTLGHFTYYLAIGKP